MIEVDMVLLGRLVMFCAATAVEDENAMERLVTPASEPRLVLPAPVLERTSVCPGLEEFVTMGFLTTMIREGWGRGCP